MRAKPIDVACTLCATITAEGVQWSRIVDAVRSKHQISNWLTQVRGPLQALANAGVVYRTKDVQNEVWVHNPMDPLTRQEVARVTGYKA